ncbi:MULTISPECIES: CoA transferase [unclassified Rhodococcus (in: high G+C Gram-positive bacteria)]|uniref:CaiB/BaiF CoA transferase family protein n=1 Tax=unclassified Rhodococcus (in: high G+C Gram-positive bacteria) TaxID=192944 RepID=UPI00144676C2|nr:MULTISPECIES: CoA transferase [unclassified Rhodococcus (in: high G+C Gram-positive bacteria)]
MTSSSFTATESDRRSGPLTGTVVIDLSRALAGPHATMMLGDLGARVVKVESPGSGDDTRGWGPPFVAPKDGSYDSGSAADDGAESTYYLAANRNKESICLNLKDISPGGDLEVLVSLIARADVLVENFRTGVMDRLGLGMDELSRINPRLVVLSITGFGHDGPEGGRAGYDQIAQGEGGLMSLTGAGPGDPQKFGMPICDLLAGMNGAYGVMAALHERHETGRGQVVRTSLLAAAVSVHAFQGTRWTVAHQVGRAAGNHHASIAPYGLFRCADGSVQIAVGNDSMWRTFCAGFGLDPAAPGSRDNSERVAHRDELIERIESIFSTWTAADLLHRLDALGIPSGRVRSIDEVYEWDQTRSQGLLVEVKHSTLGVLELPGPPLRFFDSGGHETTRTEHRAPPTLDEDSDGVRSWTRH